MQPLDSDLSKLGRPARVLVADDDAQNRELIEEVCKAEGFEPKGVSAGGEVIEAMRQEVFDLLLIDASMPGMSGWDVCRTLKADPMTREIPIIVVTATVEDAERDAGPGLDVFDVVAKPFRVFELVQRMRRALRPRSRVGDPPTAPRVRLRRRQVDVLATLPSARTLRARLTREIEACARAGRPVVCAVLRLENETTITAKVGRAVTDAVLGGVAAALLEAFPDQVVRSDLDELVVLTAEAQLDKLDAIATDAPQFTAGLGVPATIEVKIRWGARMLDAHQADADTLLDGARHAVDSAGQSGTTSHVDRS